MQTLVSLVSSQRTERDSAILPILHKALDGERLNFDEIVALLKSPDLLSMGMAANEIRFRIHPEPIVTYVVSRNINYTNVCVDYCSFCAFYRPPGHKEGYVLPLEVILQKSSGSRLTRCDPNFDAGWSQSRFAA